jgi:hypothetical protein
MQAHPSRQLHCRWRHQPHHCPTKNQVHGSPLMVAPLPRISTTVPLLLGHGQSQLGRLPHQAPPTNLPQSQQTHPCQCSSPTTLNCCPCQAPLSFPNNIPTSTPGFFLSLRTTLRMSLQGCIVYLILTYGAHTHKACSSDLVYLVTRNLFTPLLRCK